jgi:hypothetical protein
MKNSIPLPAVGSREINDGAETLGKATLEATWTIMESLSPLESMKGPTKSKRLLVLWKI